MQLQQEMIGYVKTGKNEKSGVSYVCAVCGTLITNSSLILRVFGAEEHSFVNPSGVRLNFRTFVDCTNVAVHSDLFLVHSWFAGYGWRFLSCSTCYLHLGWKYDSVKKGTLPANFFGVLVDAVQPKYSIS
jgi:hypothetical protein